LLAHPPRTLTNSCLFVLISKGYRFNEIVSISAIAQLTALPLDILWNGNVVIFVVREVLPFSISLAASQH